MRCLFRAVNDKLNQVGMRFSTFNSVMLCWIIRGMNSNIAIPLSLSAISYFVTLHFSLEHRDEYQKALCVQQEYIVRNNAKLSYCNNRIDI